MTISKWHLAQPEGMDMLMTGFGSQVDYEALGLTTEADMEIVIDALLDGPDAAAGIKRTADAADLEGLRPTPTVLLSPLASKLHSKMAELTVDCQFVTKLHPFVMELVEAEGRPLSMQKHFQTCVSSLHSAIEAIEKVGRLP